MNAAPLLILAFSTALFAPQQPAPATIQAGDQAQASKATVPAPQIALLHVYRPSEFFGAALFPSIYVDGEQVARVGNGRRVTIKLTPGSHSIKSDDKGSAITLDARAGEDYFVRLEEVQAIPKAKGKVTLMPPEQGTHEYDLQRPIEESRVVAPNMVDSGEGRLAQAPSPKSAGDSQSVAGVPEQENKVSTTAPSPVSSQAASADASPGDLVPYEGQKNEFTISLPKGWVAQDQSLMPGVKEDSRFNIIIFYLSPNPSSRDSKTVPFELVPASLMTKVDTGEIPSFFAQKLPAKKGMSCDGFSESAEKYVFKTVTGVPTFGKGATIVEAPRSEPISFAGCKGIRVRGTGQASGASTPETNDVYAASDGKTLYLFSLRNHADYYKKNVDVFQKSLATARLTAAK